MDAVLLNSGGIDSRVAAAIAKANGWTLHSLFIDYNPYNRERAKVAAKNTADLYCVDHEILTFDRDWMFEVPGKNIFGFPVSNYVVHALAGSYSIHKEWWNVVSGIRADSYVDNYLDRLQDIMSETKMLSRVVRYFDPIRDYPNYTTVVAVARQLNVPLDDTVSCGRGPLACGVCTKCQERIALGIAAN